MWNVNCYLEKKQQQKTICYDTQRHIDNAHFIILFCFLNKLSCKSVCKPIVTLRKVQVKIKNSLCNFAEIKANLTTAAGSHCHCHRKPFDKYNILIQSIVVDVIYESLKEMLVRDIKSMHFLKQSQKYSRIIVIIQSSHYLRRDDTLDHSSAVISFIATWN